MTIGPSAVCEPLCFLKEITFSMESDMEEDVLISEDAYFEILNETVN